MVVGSNFVLVLFLYFLDIVLEWKQCIIDCLIVYYLWFIVFFIDENVYIVFVIFVVGDFQEQLNEIVLYFGYIGYELVD